MRTVDDPAVAVPCQQTREIACNGRRRTYVRHAIGGSMPGGYCPDCTRTYAIGSPPPEFIACYEVLRAAQDAACTAVMPGITAEAVDAAARDPITAA